MSSRRCICLSKVTLSAWRLHRRRTSSDLVFLNSLDEAQESSSVTSALEVALERAELPQIRVHDLRHTCTILLEAPSQAGPGPAWTRTVALTLNTYSHVTSGLSREVARTFDSIFGATGRTSDIAV